MRSSIAYIVNINAIKDTLAYLKTHGIYEPVRLMANELYTIADDRHLFDMSDEHNTRLPNDFDLSRYNPRATCMVDTYKISESHVLMNSSGDLDKDTIRQVLTFADVFDCYAMTKSSASWAIEHGLDLASNHGHVVPRYRVFHVLAEMFAEGEYFGTVADKRAYLSSLHAPSIVDEWDDDAVESVFISTLASDLAWLNEAIMADVQVLISAEDVVNYYEED
jgi:hypothetical protein